MEYYPYFIKIFLVQDTALKSFEISTLELFFNKKFTISLIKLRYFLLYFENLNS